MKIYLEADNVPNHLSLALFQSFKMGHLEDTVKNGMVMKVGLGWTSRRKVKVVWVWG